MIGAEPNGLSRTLRGEEVDVVRFFRREALSDSAALRIATKIYKVLGFQPLLDIEHGFYVGLSASLTPAQYETLRDLLWKTFDPEGFGSETFLENPTVIEIGPNSLYPTPWSTRAVAICRRIGLLQVQRIERTTRYGIREKLTEEQIQQIAPALFNKMTEEPYWQPLTNFEHGIKPEPLEYIPIMEEGIQALVRFNMKLGLGMDDVDLRRNYELAVRLGRNLTDVEGFQIGQGDSNHCRHWDYNGIFYINGVRSPRTLMQRIKGPYLRRPGNATGAFDDNSSAIRGYTVPTLIPARPGHASVYVMTDVDYDITISAETHNHPSMWESFQGAGTGLIGIVRDEECERNGAHFTTSSVGFGVGNLCLPGDDLPWEKTSWRHLPVRQTGLEILLGIMAGAYGSGNCFGIPVDNGFLRTFGMELPDPYDPYATWEKPCVFINIEGKIPHANMRKQEIQVGDWVIYFGGPAYRVGIGGGSASSQDAGSISEELDFSSVQRVDPAQGNVVDRVVQACAYMIGRNIVIKKHDSGAGGSANNLSEAVYPLGADIWYDKLPMGDETLSKREGWGNESQEHNAAIVRGEANRDEFLAIAKREGCFAAVVGQVTGTRRFVLCDSQTGEKYVDLPMEELLGDRPPKEYHFDRLPITRTPLEIPSDLTVRRALEMVMRLPSAGSKEALVTSVDGSVGGLVAQGQRVGPMSIPVSDCAVTALSHFSTRGSAKSIGERPLIGFISPQAQVRMTFAEALLNLAGVVVSDFRDIKCQSNFMTALRHPNQGAWIDDAVTALEAFVDELVACQPTGGKDSSSMSATMISPEGKVVKVRAPSEFVVSTQVTVPDITRRVTPYLNPGDFLIWVDLQPERKPLGCSALAQVLGQIGNDYPDIEARRLEAAFRTLQDLVREGVAITALHDISDDGLILAVLEMAFASNTGLDIRMKSPLTALETLFSGSPGVVVACHGLEVDYVTGRFEEAGLCCHQIGRATVNTGVTLVFNQEIVLIGGLHELREIWRETSYRLDELQSNPASIAQEREVMRTLAKEPPAHLTYMPRLTPQEALERPDKPRAVVLRAECTNGDRELASLLQFVGFEVSDFNMDDLITGEASIRGMDLLALAGGFADGDVPETAVGWVKTIQENPIVREQFAEFRARPDTLVFGVCNGFQVLTRLGWLPDYELELRDRPVLQQNKSERFQCRLVGVRFEQCRSVFTEGMAGSIFPQVWVAHGEGYPYFPDPGLIDQTIDDGLVAMTFVDFDGQPTETYPFNPNGSPTGITGLSSMDGRVLGIMPHLERSFQLWQMSWLPEAWQKLEASPCLQPFQNAYDWCLEHR